MHHNIIERLQDLIEFNLFLRAIFKTNFGDILAGRGPYTVMAPIDASFDLLADRDKQRLWTDQDLLGMVVANHVVIAKLNSKEIGDLDSVQTMANQSLAIEIHPEGLIVGGGKIIKPDIICSNGIIQVVDLVLMP